MSTFFSCFHNLTHYHTMPHIDQLKIYSSGKHCNKQFLLFSKCFPHYMALIFHFKCTSFKMWSANSFNVDQSTILSSDNGLTRREIPRTITLVISIMPRRKSCIKMSNKLVKNLRCRRQHKITSRNRFCNI